MIYQGENATLVGAIVDTFYTGAEEGAYIDFTADAVASAEWTIDSTIAGETLIDLRYAVGDSQDRTLLLEVNGTVIDANLIFTSTGAWNAWGSVSVLANLVEGTNSIRLVSDGESGPLIDSLAIETGSDQLILTRGELVTLQAEEAAIDGAAISSLHSGAEGGDFVNVIAETGEVITWSVTTDSTQEEAILDLRYALGAASARDMAVAVNGVVVVDSLSFNSTGSWSTWGANTLTVDLAEGVNTISLIATGDSGPNFDSLTITAPELDPIVPGTLQAEDAILTGGLILTDHSGSEGSYFDFQTPAGESIEWTISSNGDQPDVALDFRYALGVGAARTMTLEVNGQIMTDAFDFNGTGTWSTWEFASINVDLNDGENSIRLISTGDSGPNIDSLSYGVSELPQFGDITDGTNELEPNEDGVFLDAAFGIGIVVNSPGDAIEQSTVTAETVFLINNDTGELVSGSVNTTGGRDSISFTPNTELDANTSYTLTLDGVQNIDGQDFVSVSRDFTTGTETSVTDTGDVGFSSVVVSVGDSIASLTFNNDYSMLYATTLDGKLLRWNVADDGSLLGRQEFQVEEVRTLIGLAFDPNEPNRLWVTNNDGLFGGSNDNFSSKLTYIDIADGEDFDGVVTDFATGFPRSNRDHLTNSIDFGPDGMLYLTQGSQSAMGLADDAWGNREEEPLSAAVLKVDITQNPPEGGFNINTDEGYDPDADGAPVTVYASGLRNAYDLVWHSNGNLYSANNGSAAGGNSPDDPDTAEDETIIGGATQNDYLYNVVEDGYYGHPNPTRDEYIRDGGNPTSDVDTAEVTDYVVGTDPEDNYQGFAYDFGQKRSPNGITEYVNDSYNSVISGALLVAEYSSGDRILGLEVNDDGSIGDSFVVAGGLDNPLDVVVHDPSGNVYVAALGAPESSADDSLILLRPDDVPEAEPVMFEIIDDKAVASVDHFVFHEAVGANGTSIKDQSVRTIEIANTSDSVLEINSLSFEGDDNFIFVDTSMSNGAPVAVGESLFVDVLFDASARDTYEGSLIINSNDPEAADFAVDLRGIWAPGVSGANEPTVTDVLDVFDWATDAQGGIVTKADIDFSGVPTLIDEDASVIVDGIEKQAYYFEAANADEEVTVTQLAAFHTNGPRAFASVIGYDYDSSAGDVTDSAAYSNATTLFTFAHDSNQGNTLLQDINDDIGQRAMASFDFDGPFMFVSDGRGSNPDYHNDMQAIRILEIYDQETGDRIEDSYVIAMDYASSAASNFDYQDNMFLITNVTVFDDIA